MIMRTKTQNTSAKSNATAQLRHEMSVRLRKFQKTCKEQQKAIEVNLRQTKKELMDLLELTPVSKTTKKAKPVQKVDEVKRISSKIVREPKIKTSIAETHFTTDETNEDSDIMKISHDNLFIEGLKKIGKPATTREIAEMIRTIEPRKRRLTTKRKKIFMQIVYNTARHLFTNNVLTRTPIGEKSFAYSLAEWGDSEKEPNKVKRSVGRPRKEKVAA